MVQQCFMSALIYLVGLLSVVSASTSQQQCEDSGGTAEVRAGYWLTSSCDYSPVSSIDASLYTHLYYISLSIDETSSAVALPPPDQSSLLAVFSTTAKATNPSVKTILSIGTDEYKVDVSNAAFSRMAADKGLREVFINSSVELARAYGFDGLDLSWLFPATQVDMENLGVLLAEWRAGITEESASSSSDPLLLTATLHFSNHLFDMPNSNLDYPIDGISNNLDWGNILTFGFHGNSNITTADAPLYDKSSHFSVSYGVVSWLDAGVPPCKLVMGIPLFGRSWFLRNKAKNGLGSPTAAAGTKQRMSNQTGVIAYAEIEGYLNSESTVVTYDNQSVAEYFYNGDLWVSFDSAQVVQKKVEFAVRSHLLGYFLWTVGFDDSNSTIATQASESWHQYAQGGFGTRHAGAPNKYVAYNSTSVSHGTWYSRVLSYLLSSLLLLVILFH
ncbi:hypothetical protein ACP4OV_013101 [Aristida adscensionis]